MKLNKKQLPFYAAFVQTAQYTLAGWLFMGWLGAVCVGLMGSLVSLSMAYATSQFSDIAQKRKGASMMFLLALMSFSPILIGTATFIHLTQVTNLIWRGVVCAAWGFLPDGATALAGFIAGKGLVEQSENKPKVSSKLDGKKQDKKKQEPQVARKHVKDGELLAYLQANAGASQQQVADHFGVTRQAIGPRIKKLYQVKSEQ